ncbi:pyridoxamine 5'-phosphate oxidase family protein [Chloroflexota bacterium]
MRRSDREIEDKREIEAIIASAEVCHLGLSDGTAPYVVAMDFGYKDNCLYFHCAREGKKIDIIKQNDNACFEMFIDHTFLKPEGRPCGWGAKYRSVIGFGKASILENHEERSAGMNIVTQHYGSDYYTYSESELERVNIIRVEVTSITGKKVGY